MNLFSTDTRKKIPIAQYWGLYDTYSVGSLQLAPSLSEKQMQSRLEVLVQAESQFGFAFDAEKIWLEEALGSSSFDNYPDWLLRNINQHLLDEPLLWGVDSTGPIYSLVDDPDCWHGNISNIESKGFSFDLGCDDEIKNFSTSFGLSVYGVRSRPSAIHLVQGFKQLFNTPYHLQDVKDRLLCQPTKNKQGNKAREGFAEYGWIGVENISKKEPEHWQLSLSNHYESWEGIDFIGRQAQPRLVEPNPVRIAFEKNQFAEWDLPAEGKHASIPPRLVFKYRDHFDAEDLSKHLRSYGQFAYLCETVTCQCGEISQFYFQFKWGQLNSFIEYRIGSEITWDGAKFGYPELETVYVVASADMHCLKCRQTPDDTLICIKNNRIHSLMPELLEKIKYPFKGPFVSDKFITWENYQIIWIKEQWNALKKATDIEEFDHCVLPDLTDWKTSTIWSENHQYLNLVSKYRHSIDPLFFERCVLQRPINIHGMVDEDFSINAQLKSCAILHTVHNNEPILVKFYWGSLLDFPEYEIGDTIRWSEYSTGDEDLEAVVYARGFVEGDHSIKTIIEIKHNEIVNFHFDHDKPNIDTLSYNEQAHAFYGERWLPWLVVPDDLFIKTRRPLE